MSRAVLWGLGLLCVAACRTSPEPLPLRPLPDNSPPLSYNEALQRARMQAALATEGFYIDSWPDVEYAARGLEQTARFLKKSIDVPVAQRDKLEAAADQLAKQARRLREAAAAQDARQVNESLQQVHLAIRSLRPEA